MTLVLCAVVFLFSLWLTALIRRFALARQILDVPNHRSSHTSPTPRGGGIAFVVALFAGLCLGAWGGLVSVEALQAFLFPGVIVAFLGAVDDRSHIPARWRLAGHFVAATLAVYLIGGFPALRFGESTYDLGIWGDLFSVLFLVWMTNLYNFMDGIDGIAAGQAVTVGVGFAVLLASMGTPAIIPESLLLSAAVAGFLCWNFPFAKIFMGDAGSGFLGLGLGILTLLCARLEPNLFWCGLLLSGVFIVDATLTLFWRIASGKKFYEAHRSHGYQIAARRLEGHWKVTAAVFAINVLWLLPIAWSIGAGALQGWLGLLLGYCPLILLDQLLKAGRQP